MVSFKNFLIFTQDVTDASVNTCCKLKLVFLEKRQDSLVFGQTVFRNQMGILYQILWCMSQTSRDRDNGRRVRTPKRTQEKLFAD